MSLSVTDLSITYPPRVRGGAALTVLDRVDLQVSEGEFYSLVGPSGCGKTTLLRTLAGLHSPASGSIEIPESIAMVFQRPTLMPWRTVIDNALFGLECRDGSITHGQRRKAEGLLDSMGLVDHLRDHPHELSEGMQQRVNLARALLTDPDVLLLDEPFAALDAITRRTLQDDLLDRCRRRRITAILVSHSLEEVAYLADRVSLLSDKPSRVIATESIRLERPRGQTPKAQVALHETALRLHRVLASGQSRSTASTSEENAVRASP